MFWMGGWLSVWVCVCVMCVMWWIHVDREVRVRVREVRVRV